MSNDGALRAELGRLRRRAVQAPLWEYLLEQGWVEDARAEATVLKDQAAYLHEKVRAMETAVHGDAVVLRAPRDDALRARVDALSAIYAAWAAQDVRWFRIRRLMRTDDTVALKAYYTGGGPHPGYALLNEDAVLDWVLGQLQACAPGQDPNQYIAELVQQQQPGDRDPVVVLEFVADGRPVRQTVPRAGVLGELAELASKIAGTYRWHPAWAALFVLTGARPTVLTHTASAQIRYGTGAAGTRIALTVDPALPPQQVAELFGQVRSALQPEPPVRAQALRSYRLAEHVGPHLLRYPVNPQDAKRRGRPRRADPPGTFVYSIDPVGCTWQELRRSWNARYPDTGEDGKPWRYESLSNFTRDAQQAYLRLLDPRWTPPGEGRRRPG
ncbi:hypothetical protein ACWDZ8_38365 [Streptomyces sp. NPDC003233]